MYTLLDKESRFCSGLFPTQEEAATFARTYLQGLNMEPVLLSTCITAKEALDVAHAWTWSVEQVMRDMPTVRH